MSQLSNEPPEDLKEAMLATFGWMSVVGVLSVLAIIILAIVGPLGKV